MLETAVVGIFFWNLDWE